MTIDDLPPITPDPVIEAFKKDVDRTLLRENLRLTVDQRLEQLQEMARLDAELAASRQRHRASVLEKHGLAR